MSALRHGAMSEACEDRRVLDPVVLLLQTAAGVCLLIATWKNGLRWKFEGVAETWAFAALTLWILSLVIAAVAN